MSRPADHFSSARADREPAGFGPRAWTRWAWRQLTSMRTALLLLLLLAIAAIPGSLVPQRTADPNGVTQFFRDNPGLAPVIDAVQGFDVYSSAWFSSIYLLLFVSLIGCIIPRSLHHARALRQSPPAVPTRMNRLPAHLQFAGIPLDDAVAAIDRAETYLRAHGYRTIRSGPGEPSAVSAERGYLRETGNLLFHTALIGVLIAGGIGSGFGYTGQRVVIEGQTFINSLGNYDSFNPGRFFDPRTLDPYSVSLDSFTVDYEERNLSALGQPVDYTATVTTRRQGRADGTANTIKVNEPLAVEGSQVYLLGNGYAPVITVRDPAGNITFSDPVAFLPQDANLTSTGVVKVPDGLAEQLGMVGFFYPTQEVGSSGASYSNYPDLEYPVLTLNVFVGDLGIDNGTPRSVYALDTSNMRALTGTNTGAAPLQLKPGDEQPLPGGLGSISFDEVKRFASLEVHHDPAQGWVLLFAILALAGLLTGLFIPRRRLWARASDGTDSVLTLEFAGLARGDDPGLIAAVEQLAQASRPHSFSPHPTAEGIR